MPKLLIFAVASLASMPAAAVTINFADFTSTAGLSINGSAAAAVDGSNRNVLRVTPAIGGQSGSVFSTSPITLGAAYSFSTRYTFNFNNQGNSGADGLVFVVQTNSNSVGGAGGGIGYAGILNSVGIEFDNWNNGDVDASSDNHAGINVNGNMNSVAINSSLPFSLDSGQDLTAWVDYNGASNLLEVRLNNSNSRPGAALLSHNVDLSTVLGTTSAYVGFTSGTGAAWANHDVINWEFRDTFNPIGGVPEPASWALMIAGFGMVGTAMRRRVRVMA